MKINKNELLLYFFAAVVMFIVPFFINSSSVFGKPPPIQTTTLSGEKVKPLSQFRLIYFWAEWCGVCKMTQAPVSAVLQDYPGLTIAVKSGNDTFVKNYLTQQGLTWLTVNDNRGEISRQYGINGVPAVFVLNSDGEVAFATSGYNSELGLRLRLWLAEL